MKDWKPGGDLGLNRRVMRDVANGAGGRGAGFVLVSDARFGGDEEESEESEADDEDVAFAAADLSCAMHHQLIFTSLHCVVHDYAEP
jgi:hypothetical protein